MMVLGPELPAVDASLTTDSICQIVRPLRFFFGKCRDARYPVISLDRETLRDRRALWQHAIEICVMPMRREMNPGVVVEVAIDQAGQRGERQIETIDRMRE